MKASKKKIMIQEKRDLLVSKSWIQAVIVVGLFGFLILGILAYRTYTDEPPIPSRVVSANGQLLFTGEDITAGQEVFLKNGLMEYGSIFGHGAYLGPDFTTDYLHRAALISVDQYGGSTSDSAREKTIADFKANQYDDASKTLMFSAAQAEAFHKLVDHYGEFFSTPDTRNGLRPSAITDTEQIRQLTAFFSWSAWTASALRPNLNYSYTNNWPPEPLVGNHATADALVWSVLSLIALLGGTGLLLAAFGRWNFLGWHGREDQYLSFRPPNQVVLTPAQRSCAWFFLVMALLFLMQALLGGATEHYRAEITNFFGFDLARILPFNIARTWHVQLSLLWVSTSFLAAGIFLVPMITGKEPSRQHWLSYGLLLALAVVVFGSMAGEYAGIQGWIQRGWSWFGNQGFEYLDLGRFFQVLLSVGLVFWVILLFRGLRSHLRTESMGNMPWLFFFSALAIPAFYAVGLLARTNSHFTTTDFWRFWVVHLWVEDFLELFTTVMVAYMFVLLGVVSAKTALRVIYLDAILYSVGGVVGTMHHFYFSGGPAVHMALGAFFSAGEVIPLTFLTVEAWTFLHLGARQEVSGGKGQFPHRWAVLFLVAVGFWNFLGAGIFGFLINLPMVSYYQIGTQLTANHGHAAFAGVYVMLALALLVFALRYLVRPEDWNDRWVGFSFWALNLGLVWMVFFNLFPLGVLQLGDSVANGYWHARSLEFFRGHTFIEWLRLPGDIIFIAGVLPIVYLTARAVWRPRPTLVAETMSLESP